MARRRYHYVSVRIDERLVGSMGKLQERNKKVPLGRIRI